MPLVTFDVARKFVVHNTERVLNLIANDIDNIENDVYDFNSDTRFRLKAMKLDECFKCCNDDDGGFVFKGYNDSLFDEAIYSANHLLCAPGACKASSSFGGMMPVLDYVNGSVMSTNRIFSDMFAPCDNVFDVWKNGLVTRLTNAMNDGVAAMTDGVASNVLIEGMTPSIAFPCKMRFHKSKRIFEKENYNIDYTLFRIRISNAKFENMYHEKRRIRGPNRYGDL